MEPREVVKKDLALDREKAGVVQEITLLPRWPQSTTRQAIPKVMDRENS